MARTHPPTAPAPPNASAREVSDTGRRGLYTPEERRRRDESPWTLVQGVLAPLQFLVMIVSVVLLVRYLGTGSGAGAAEWSVIVKTGLLYLIMVTGSIWEKEVFGEWLFAEPFFWEDVVSMGVILLHTAYLVGLFAGIGSGVALAWLALVAYAVYTVNAVQFVLKLRAARLQEQEMASAAPLASRAGSPA
ncbi:MAG: 2-vinyl bacteriochlorophyllide hydratase [Gemmatimonadales bacterium]|nr:MAG: 2-vinyl bacteriochlorophyllide hydratase [Gemmatimonadales bacterium]